MRTRLDAEDVGSIELTWHVFVHSFVSLFASPPCMRACVRACACVQIVRRDSELLDRMGFQGYSLVVGYYEEASEKMLANKGGRFPSGTTMPASLPFVCRCADGTALNRKVLRAHYFAIALFMNVSSLSTASSDHDSDDAWSDDRPPSVQASPTATAAANNKKKKQILRRKSSHAWDDASPTAASAPAPTALAHASHAGSYGERFLHLVATKVTNAAAFQPHPLTLATSALRDDVDTLRPYATATHNAPSAHSKGGGGVSGQSNNLGVFSAASDGGDLERQCKSAVWYYNSSLAHMKEHWQDLKLQDLGINSVYVVVYVHIHTYIVNQ